LLIDVFQVPGLLTRGGLSLIKELQPEASQRAIADLVGVSHPTIQSDLGGKKLPPTRSILEYEIDKNGKDLPPPALPPDDKTQSPQAQLPGGFIKGGGRYVSTAPIDYCYSGIGIARPSRTTRIKYPSG
jgi:hypothetical protein